MAENGELKRDVSVLDVMDWVSRSDTKNGTETTPGIPPKGSRSYVDPSCTPKNVKCWPQRLDSDTLQEDYSTVMVLYCGGTIGMRTKNGGKIQSSTMRAT